jgi:ribose transport system substrate-binding protein
MGTNRRRFLKATGAIGIGSFAGCTDIGGGGGGGFEQIGYSSYVRGGSWITAYVDAGKFYAEDTGVEMDVRPNQQSASKQVQDIRDFVNQGYDGIIVGIWQTGAAKDALDNGVPVFPTNADTANENVPMYTGFSNYEGGKKCAEEMLKALENQRSDKDTWGVLNVRGAQGNQSANQRSKGFLDVMKENDRIEVLRTFNGDYARDVAQEKVQEWISANRKPDGIYSGNLSMGLGTLGALKNLDMRYKKSDEKHVVLTQMDGSPEVNPLVAEGYIDAAVDQPNYFYNPIAIEMMRQYVEEGEDAVPNVGSEITTDDFSVESHEHTIGGQSFELWSEPIWAPGEMKEQNSHPWFKTNSIVITQENADAPYLWGNIWG